MTSLYGVSIVLYLYAGGVWGGGGPVGRGLLWRGEVTPGQFTHLNRFLRCFRDIENESYSVDLFIHVNLFLFIGFNISVCNYRRRVCCTYDMLYV